jgi:type I restriction enzyme, S subunit
MNAERLLDYYEKVADAPDGIRRLRRFVLDLAVRGKLVAQDANDEPASELLHRVAEEKMRIGNNSVSSPLQASEVPFELPAGWSWSRIGELCSKTGSGSTPRGGKEVYRDAGIPFLRSQNIHDDGLRLADVAHIAIATHERMAGTHVLPGDLLFNITGGSIGRCCRVPNGFGDANVSQHVAIIRPAVKQMGGFLHHLILSPYFQAFVFDEQTGAGRGGLPKNRMDRIPVAVPPLAEQHRIVAKVNELMALCDRLEAARAKREVTRDRFTVASLARLSAADPDTFRDDARFALDALPALTDRADQIKQLRQAILNLAVRGKLVPQDSNDEPASELLERIAAEKASFRRSTVAIDGQSEPFAIPSSWKWVALGGLIVAGPQNGTSPKPTRRGDEAMRSPNPGYLQNSTHVFNDHWSRLDSLRINPMENLVRLQDRQSKHINLNLGCPKLSSSQPTNVNVCCGENHQLLKASCCQFRHRADLYSSHWREKAGLMLFQSRSTTPLLSNLWLIAGQPT